jgi:hypothetical protein
MCYSTDISPKAQQTAHEERSNVAQGSVGDALLTQKAPRVFAFAFQSKLHNSPYRQAEDSADDNSDRPGYDQEQAMHVNDSKTIEISEDLDVHDDHMQLLIAMLQYEAENAAIKHKDKDCETFKVKELAGLDPLRCSRNENHRRPPKKFYRSWWRGLIASMQNYDREIKKHRVLTTSPGAEPAHSGHGDSAVAR